MQNKKYILSFIMAIFLMLGGIGATFGQNLTLSSFNQMISNLMSARDDAGALNESFNHYPNFNTGSSVSTVGSGTNLDEGLYGSIINSYTSISTTLNQMSAENGVNIPACANFPVHPALEDGQIIKDDNIGELIDDANRLISCMTSIESTMCGVDLYRAANGGTCVNVGDGFYSQNSNNRRESCTNGGGSLYDYTSSGRGSSEGCDFKCVGFSQRYNSSSPRNGTCACGVDKYLSGGKCVSVGVGYYSPANNNSIKSCSIPLNAKATSDGNGSNNCSWSCNAGYGETTKGTCKKYYRDAEDRTECNAKPQRKYKACDGGKSKLYCSKAGKEFPILKCKLDKKVVDDKFCDYNKKKEYYNDKTKTCYKSCDKDDRPTDEDGNVVNSKSC